MLEEILLGGEYVFSMEVHATAPLDLGPRADGVRRMVPIAGGKVDGPRLRGRILPGADWQLVQKDGLVQLEAHHPIEADDGTLIEFTNRGVRDANAETARRLQAGERVDPARYYFRSAATFSAPAGCHDWLNRGVFVGIGARLPECVAFRFFRVS
jgi:hypothetical protein